MFERIALSVESAYFHEEVLKFDAIKLVMTHPLSPKEWTSSDSNFDVVDQFSLMDKAFDSQVLSQLLLDHPDAFSHMTSFLSDYDTYHVFERKMAQTSLMGLDVNAADIFYKTYHLLLQYQIDTLVVHDTPHSLVDYALSKCAHYLGIKIYNIRRSFLPWRVTVFEGLWHKSTPLRKGCFAEPKPADLKMANAYQAKLKGDYLAAMPDYERKRYEVNKGKLWSWKKELKWWATKKYRPQLLMSIKAKRQTYNEMLLHSRKPKEGEKYAAFYLHFQPERTTCPEGGIFNTQLIAVQFLRSLLPSDVAIYVREHPSTFRNVFNLRVRPYGYYKSFSDIDNVYIGSQDQDSYEFLDQSVLCATITGTIGFEATNRNKRCIYFGDAGFRGCPGTYHISEFLEDTDLMSRVLGSLDVSLEDKISEFITNSLPDSSGEISENQSFTDYDIFQSNWAIGLVQFLQSMSDSSKAH